ncbi:phosphatase PAP2 family protein [Actinorugispora endophytica]|uniref:Undecaprenyl-diphosphatase n=1 Tax=Actinorugispora endophytica TaxID=1605990 RepID=A0A4R6UZX8_9ACTN|nr:phosphatase PAP2 family protein [Actinorugispora endophytica]TDQ51593.1 undecaprenyl-diphosphatase [Actinorugispora endophytica]
MPRGVGWGSVGLLAAFAAMTTPLAFGIAVPLLKGLDTALTEAVAGERTPFLTAVATFCHVIGGWPWGGLLLAGLVVPLLLRRRWEPALLVVCAWAVTSLAAVPAAKALLGRARPLDPLVLETSPSYPSGHAAFAGALAAAAVAVSPGRARVWTVPAAVAFTALMAWSRMYLGAHWFSDTVGGALLGWGVGLLVWGAVLLPRPSFRFRRRS